MQGIEVDGRQKIVNLGPMDPVPFPAHASLLS